MQQLIAKTAGGNGLVDIELYDLIVITKAIKENTSIKRQDQNLSRLITGVSDPVMMVLSIAEHYELRAEFTKKIDRYSVVILNDSEANRVLDYISL